MCKMVYNVGMNDAIKILGVCEKTATSESIEGQFNTIMVVFVIALVVIVGSLLILRRVLQWSPTKRKGSGTKTGVIISVVLSVLFIIAVVVILTFWGDIFQDPLNC